jgi:hypothetical protein
VLLVVFVINVANDLLQQVLERDEAKHWTVALANDGKVLAVLQHRKQLITAPPVDRGNTDRSHR